MFACVVMRAEGAVVLGVASTVERAKALLNKKVEAQCHILAAYVLEYTLDGAPLLHEEQDYVLIRGENKIWATAMRIGKHA